MILVGRDKDLLILQSPNTNLVGKFPLLIRSDTHQSGWVFFLGLLSSVSPYTLCMGTSVRTNSQTLEKKGSRVMRKLTVFN